jgi:hypothetical protein
MRNELKIMDEIESYLTNKLSATERSSFENRMLEDADLAEKVNQQKALTQAIKRAALRSQINTVAAGGGGGFSFSQIFLGSIGIVGIIGSVIYFVNQNEQEEIVSESSIEKTIEPTAVAQLSKNNERNFQLTKEIPETIFSSIHQFDDIEDKLDIDPVDFPTNPHQGTTIIGNSHSVNQNSDQLASDNDYSGTNKDRKAMFPGGSSSLKKFIDKNLYYPRSASDKNIECLVQCDFHVTEDGLITEIEAKCIKIAEVGGEQFNDIKLIRNKKLVNAFINNSTHVLRSMPIWVPARNKQGNPVLSYQRLYFNFDLEKGCLVYQLDEDLNQD